MASSRKKSAQGLQLDEIYLEGAQERAGFWSDDAQAARPLSARKDIEGFDGVQNPANDLNRRTRRPLPPASEFIGSRHFLAASAATLACCGLFTVLMGFGTTTGLAALAGSPGQYPMFWAALAVIAAMPWLFAITAHRQYTNDELLRRVMLATQRLQEPSALAADAGRRINTSFEHVFADIDARMALLDQRSTMMADQIAASMHQSSEAANLNLTNMRNIIEASETQREALQRRRGRGR